MKMKMVCLLEFNNIQRWTETYLSINRLRLLGKKSVILFTEQDGLLEEEQEEEEEMYINKFISCMNEPNYFKENKTE